MGYVINLLNFPIIAKKSSFSFVPLPMKLGIRHQRDLFCLFFHLVTFLTFIAKGWLQEIHYHKALCLFILLAKPALLYSANNSIDNFTIHLTVIFSFNFSDNIAPIRLF
ncbi:MAG: hypothetical protein ACR5K9_02715 [Wolbachia sp.]